MMINRISWIGVSLGFVAIALPGFAAELKQQQVVATESVKFVASGTIRVIHSYGDLYIEGWDRPDVEITVIKSMPYDYKEKQPGEASQHLERIKVGSERKSDNELEIATILPVKGGTFSLPESAKGHVAVEYRIRAPRDSKLDIQHGTGSVFVNNMTGDIEAECGRGDIILMLPDSGAYSIDAKSKLGSVVSDFDGTPRLRRYRLGESYATETASSARRIFLRVGFGGITIKAILPESYPAGNTR